MGGDRWRSASLEKFASEVAAAGPEPAAGAVAAAACAFAAALVELALEAEDPGRARAAELRERALELVDADVRAYGRLAAARSGEDGADLAAARHEASAPPLEIAEAAAGVAELAERARRDTPGPRGGDAAAAIDLARGARRAALGLVEANREDAGASGGEAS